MKQRMKTAIWIKWIFFSMIIFTSLVLPLALLEPSISNYENTALDWAGSNKLLISFIVILALTADVILPVPNGLTNTFAGMSLGWAISSVVVWIGLNLGATLAYALGRFAGRPIAKKLISNQEFEEAETALKNFNIFGLIISRPVPGFAELTAITAGLSKIPFKLFFLVVSTVNIGVAVIFSGIGAAAIESDSSSLAFFGAALLPAALYFFYVKFYKS
jgi:uncharacterized membrane protein YdjX (TVP38/TMEM64 family)|tara:strand:+ start:66 stop:719 length:654 start_codon:yes stop_codon:yes gene_type:complete